MTYHAKGYAPTKAWVRFDRWAGALLMLLALIAVVASLLVVSATPPGIMVAAVFAAGLAAAGIHAIAVLGLAEGRKWARPVAVLLLWLAIVVGLIDVARDLAGGGILIPFGAIGAAVVLRTRPRDRPPWPAGQWPAVGIALAVFLFSVALPFMAVYLFRVTTK